MNVSNDKKVVNEVWDLINADKNYQTIKDYKLSAFAGFRGKTINTLVERFAPQDGIAQFVGRVIIDAYYDNPNTMTLPSIVRSAIGALATVVALDKFITAVVSKKHVFSNSIGKWHLKDFSLLYTEKFYVQLQFESDDPYTFDMECNVKILSVHLSESDPLLATRLLFGAPDVTVWDVPAESDKDVLSIRCCDLNFKVLDEWFNKHNNY